MASNLVRSEPTKRKTRTRYISSSSSDEERGLYYLVSYSEKNKLKYSIIEENKLKKDPNIEDKGFVKHMGKSLVVQIIKKGDSDYIHKKAEKYAKNESMDTTSAENESSQKIQKTNPNNVSSIFVKKKNFNPYADGPIVSERVHNSWEKDTFSITTDATLSETTSKTAFSNEAINQEETSHLNSQTPRSADYISRADYIEMVDQFNRKFLELEKSITSNKKSRDENQFIFNNKNLITDPDFQKKNSIKWGLKVIDHLFTKEELREGVMETSSKTNRTALDPIRVKLLRDALAYKYSYNSEKLDKVWSVLKDRINTKGRNIGFRFRQLIKMSKFTNDSLNISL